LVVLEKTENRNPNLKINPGQAYDPSGGQVTDNSAFDKLTELAKMLGDPQTWKRVLYTVIGGLLLIIFLFKVTGDNKMSGTTKGLIKSGIKLAVVHKP
jgi:hypothetical protein